MGSGKSSVLVLAQLRRFHVYLAMLAAPTLIFFSATGVLQLFSLHEAHGDYQPPAFLEKLSALHKDQVFAPHHPHGPGAVAPADTHADADGDHHDADDDHHDGDAAAPTGADGAAPTDGAHHHGRHKLDADSATIAAKPQAAGPKFDKTAHWTAPQIALKCVLAVTSTAALIATLLGVWMGFVTSGRKRLPIACFFLGLIAPLALIVMVAG